MRVLIAVTHLLGAGHLTRAAALARALARAGHATTLVSGGNPAPLVGTGAARLVQLPPLHVRGTAFSDLRGADGMPASDDLLALRRERLCAALAEAEPDAVVTELFPFGRRALAREFLALVEAARARRPRPVVVASVRDVLAAPDRPERIAQAHARVADLYDAVLVHGDPALVPLDASWPVDAALAPRLAYTGYVDEGPAVPAAGGRSGVVVAAGSSAAGLGILEAAAGAARARPDLGWRILAGHGVPEARLAALASGLPGGTVARARPDYRALLARAAASVSACGYNTAVDLLATGTRALVVPFEAGRETEQRLRAERMAARGLARVLPEAELDAGSLLAAVEALLAGPEPPPHGVALDGAARAVAAIEALAGRRSLPPLRARVPAERAEGGSATAQDRARVATSPEMSRSPLPTPFGGHPPPQRGEGDARPRPSEGPSTARCAFDRVREALDAAGEFGRRPAMWWRDDDATAASPALDRLLDLAAGHACPILVAAIPARIEPSLGGRLQGTGARLAVHGLCHANHAPAGEKPSEFGPHRPLAVLRADAARALTLARERLPADILLPVFVPPWNRLAPDLADALPDLGYRGLSAGDARAPAVPGLVRADAWLDPIDWRRTRSLADPDRLVETLLRWLGAADRPLGLLTHHLAHDAAVWDFLERLLTLLLRHGAVRPLDPRDLFGASPVDAGAATCPMSGQRADVRARPA